MVFTIKHNPVTNNFIHARDTSNSIIEERDMLLIMSRSNA